MAKAKATHYGHCQVCGRRQKAPMGLLSKHGYSVEWGFFSGTCYGAEYLPFERSTSLIELAIERALAQRKRLITEIVELRKAPADAMAFCHVYRTPQECSRWERPGYVWFYGEVQKRKPHLGQSFAVIGEDGVPHYFYVDYQATTVAEAVALQRRKYARHLFHKTSEIKRYVRWQCARIATWAPRDLEPIEAD